MESEYYEVGWLGRMKTVTLSCPEDDMEDSLEDYSFEEASIYLSSFTVNQMASLTSSTPSRRLLNSASTLCRRAMISPYCMILGLAYAKLYHRKCAQYAIGNRLGTLDLFLVSMILSNKFLIDNGEYEALSNREWARLSSKTVQEVNELETEFLATIEWQLYMPPDDFKSFSQEIEAQIVTDLVRRRGYCTYGEILSLFKWEHFNAKFHTSIRNMGMAFLSSFAFYLTGVLAFSVAIKGLSFLSQSNKDPASYNTGELKVNTLTEVGFIPDVPPHPDPLSLPLNSTQQHLPTLSYPDVEESSNLIRKIGRLPTGGHICDARCVALLSPLNLIDTPPVYMGPSSSRDRLVT